MWIGEEAAPGAHSSAKLWSPQPKDELVTWVAFGRSWHGKSADLTGDRRFAQAELLDADSAKVPCDAEVVPNDNLTHFPWECLWARSVHLEDWAVVEMRRMIVDAVPWAMLKEEVEVSAVVRDEVTKGVEVKLDAQSWLHPY